MRLDHIVFAAGPGGLAGTSQRLSELLGESFATGGVHPRFGTPHVAIAIMVAWSLILLFGTKGDLGDLLSGVVFADWIFFGLGGASVFVLRKTRPDAVRPYRSLGYPVLPALFVVAAAVGIVSAYVAATKMSLFGTGLLAVGIMVYLVTTKRTKS